MSDILSRLKPPAGSRKSRKRLGRGPGSGLGNTSGKGDKGQRARAGASNHRGFEGGQMPIQRRLPKRGFHNRFRTEYAPVNLSKLEIFAEGTVVDRQALVNQGIVKSCDTLVKILGNGDLKKKLTIRTQAASKTAIEKIEKAGGTFEKVEN
jgi:large subunit ribosomal protein L15